MSDNHFGDANKKADAATTEESSAVRQKEDTMKIKKESMVMWRVTARGLRQIADWMNDYYSDSVWEAFQSHSEIALDICSWVVRAEHANEGRIELSAASSRTGEPVSLTPERADIYVSVKPLSEEGARDE